MESIDEITRVQITNLWKQARDDYEKSKTAPDRMAYLNYLDGIERTLGVLLSPRVRATIRKEVYGKEDE